MEEIAGDMDEAAIRSAASIPINRCSQEFKEQILDDVRERKEAVL